MCVCRGRETSEKSNRCLVQFHSIARWLISFQQNVKPPNKPLDFAEEKTLCPPITSESIKAVKVLRNDFKQRLLRVGLEEFNSNLSRNAEGGIISGSLEDKPTSHLLEYYVKMILMCSFQLVYSSSAVLEGICYTCTLSST